MSLIILLITHLLLVDVVSLDVFLVAVPILQEVVVEVDVLPIANYVGMMVAMLMCVPNYQIMVSNPLILHQISPKLFNRTVT